MIKYLSVVFYTFALFINICNGQNVDSLFIGKMVNNYIYNISESAANISDDSLLCFHYDNDTIVIDVHLKFEVEFDTLLSESEPMGSVGTMCGSYADFLMDLTGDAIHMINDSLLLGRIDSTYYFPDTLTSENFAMLDTAAYNLANCYQFKKGLTNEYYAISYNVVRKNFYIIAFGRSLILYKNELNSYMNALISKYEASYPPY